MGTGRASEHRVGWAEEQADAAEKLCLGINLSAPQVNTKSTRPDSIVLEIKCYCRSWETVRCLNSCLTKELERRTVNSYLNCGEGTVVLNHCLFSSR